MKHRRKPLSLITFVVFAVLILLGGYMLDAAGYIDNPFDEIAFLSNWVSGGERRFERDFDTRTEMSDLSTSSVPVEGASIDLTGFSEDSSQFDLPPVDQLDNAEMDSASSLPDTSFMGRDGENSFATDWSSLGDVLYNFWFICATTAGFIVVQQTFNFTRKQLKNRLPAVGAAK